MTTSDRPILSLAELEAHDPRHSGRGAERRFLCPLAACADHQGRDHRNLAANVESGLWRCCRCEASGKLAERWETRERLSPRARARRAFGLSTPVTSTPSLEKNEFKAFRARARESAEQSKTPTWRKRWDQSVPVAGTPGADYLASRAIPEAIASAAGVRYLERWGHWTKDDSGAWQLEGTSRRIVFPIVDQAGELVGIQGRAIDEDHVGEKVLTNGSAGVFATSGLETLSLNQLAIVEAPIDALSLAAAGVPAVATQGTAWPAWLPRALAFKTVLLAHDADDAGDAAAAKLTPELRSWGARIQRMRPEAAKDWNEILEHGLDVLRVVIAGKAPEGHVPNPGPNPLEDDDDHDDELENQPIAAQFSAMEPRKPYVVTVIPVLVEVDELLAWLAAAPRPCTPFRL